MKEEEWAQLDEKDVSVTWVPGSLGGWRKDIDTETRVLGEVPYGGPSSRDF